MLRRICLAIVLLTLIVMVPLRADDYFRPHYHDTHVHYAASRADYRLSLAEAAAASSRGSLDYSRQRVYDLSAAIDSQQRILDQLYIDIERGEANLQALANELEAGAFTDAATRVAVDNAQLDVEEARKAVDAAWAASEQEFHSSLAYTTLAEKLQTAGAAIEHSPLSIFHRHLHQRIIKLQEQVDSLKEANSDPNALAVAEVELSETLRELAAFESILPWVDPALVAALRQYDEAQVAMNQLVENFEKLRPQNPNILAAEAKLREAEDRLLATLAAFDLPSRGDVAAAYNNQISWLNARRRDADRAEANLDSLVYQLDCARSQLICAERNFRSRLAFVSSAHYCRNVAFARLHHFDFDDKIHRKHLHERRQQWLINRPGGGEPVKGPFVGPLTEKEYREREKRKHLDDDRHDFDRAQHANFRDDDRERDDDRRDTRTLLVPAGQKPIVDMKQQPTVPTRQEVERAERRFLEIRPQPTVPTREQVERQKADKKDDQPKAAPQNKPSLQESVRRAQEEREARKDEAERKERARIADQERAAAEAERRQRIESERQTREARHAEEQARKEQVRQERQAREEQEARQRAREAEAAARAEARAREQQQEDARNRDRERDEWQRNSDNDRSDRNNDDDGRSGRNRR